MTSLNKEALQSLLNSCKDAEFRENNGTATIKSLSSPLMDLLSSSPSTKEDKTDLLQLSFKILAFLCVGSEERQGMILSIQDFPENFFKTDLKLDEAHHRAQLQLANNLIIGNESTRERVWPFIPHFVQEILSNSPTEGVKMMACALVHNCLVGSVERRLDLLQHKGLVSMILHCADTCNKSLEWVCFLVEGYLQSDKLPALFKSQQDPDKPHSSSITEKQLILLKILDGLFHASSESPSSPTAEPIETCVDKKIKVSSCSFLVGELMRAHAVATGNAADRAAASASTPQKEERQEDDDDIDDPNIAGDATALCLLLQIFSSLSGFGGSATRQQLVQEGLMHFVTKLFRNVEDNEVNTGSKSILPVVIQIMANLCFRNKQAQDELRELGGLAMILNHCRIDEPDYMREWSLLAVRNACEGNMENQDFISKLQPKGVVPSKDLDHMGLEATLSPSGKVTVKKKAAAASPLSNTKVGDTEDGEEGEEGEEEEEAKRI